MSKVTITFEDGPNDEVAITTDFDPPYDKSQAELTNAQQLACDTLEDIQNGESFMAMLTGVSHD